MIDNKAAIIVVAGLPRPVGPQVGVDLDPMAALVVGAIDHQAAHAGLAHFAKGDLLRAIHTNCRGQDRSAATPSPRPAI